MPAFVPFGRDHLGALALTALLAAGLSMLARRHGSTAAGFSLRLALAGALAGATAATLVAWSREEPLTVWHVLPLHLCDFLLLVSVFALLTRRQAACELLYFWAGAGTLLALVSPDLEAGFPDWRFVSFFVLHGLVVVSAAVLTWGFGRWPRPGAPWRALALTNAYALAVGLVNLAFGTNFLYLRGKPTAPTLLDWMGPWPIYILVADLLAAVLFWILFLPFRSTHVTVPAEVARPGRGG
jgi:hypothetical integral membrane protein (TIGR02206 family)